MTQRLHQPNASRWIAACLVIVLSTPMAEVAAAQQPQLPAQQQTAPPAAEQAANKLPEAPAPAPVTAQVQGAASDQESSSQQQQNPLGTAAAPYGTPTGVAGSRPSGAAIAPGKQKRVHSLLIRYSIIVAACAATGVVIGLSKASPSKPQ